jgi:hypothetical protein
MEGDSRVAPPQVNYDNVLPLAIEARSNRREFLPVNGQSFSNSTGATVCRIDVNADSMLDATHSYLECDLRSDAVNGVGENKFLALNSFCPSWIQRLRIESGGVVIEDINEYSRLYAMLSLCQCPQDYIKNNYQNLGLYSEAPSSLLAGAGAGVEAMPTTVGVSAIIGGGNNAVTNISSGSNELHYNQNAGAILSGALNTNAAGTPAIAIAPTNAALTAAGSHAKSRIFAGQSKRMCIPLVSGFLNMDKYIPLIMMNAGFTIELTLCDANRIGVTQSETAAAANPAPVNSLWTVNNVKYVAHLIDLDRSFYDRLRMVMDSSGGVLQLAGQTYRHFSGILGNAANQYTLSIPARVKSVKSIFGTFLNSANVGSALSFDSSVFQSAHIQSFRFEIGSVRYPQTDIDCNGYDKQAQREAELDKAWGKIGDYQHQKAYSLKHTQNHENIRDGRTLGTSTLSAFFMGYDFEAFNRVLLEQGIDTSSRSLPINVIINKGASGGAIEHRADFYVLCDAIFFINLDGTASVSV